MGNIEYLKLRTKGFQMSNAETLRKKLNRIQRALEDTEELLEMKSRQLYEANLELEKKVEERTKELESARDKALEASKAKSQFLANMSHEIRTPLNGVIGLVSVLENTKLETFQLEHVRTIKQSGFHLLSIIDEILNFSKIEAGKDSIHLSDFDLEKMIDSVVTVMSGPVFSKGLEFSVFLDEELPRVINSDPAKIKQILINLIGNAIKFTPSGEISLGVSSTASDINFTVSDTGVGIPQSKVDKIFLPFEQADISDVKKYGGTGLGLSISKYLVNRLGGHISVQSEETKGAKFTFSIPHQTCKGQMISPRQLSKQCSVGIIANSQVIEKRLIERISKWDATAEAVSVFSNTPCNKTHIILEVDQQSDTEAIERFCKINNNSRILIFSTPNFANLAQDRYKKCAHSFTFKPLKRNCLFSFLSNECQMPCEIKNSKSAPPNRKFKILVAEDNKINQTVVSAMLEQLGHSFTIANNGQEALDLFGPSEAFDLILMDCQMPIMDGFEATEKLRSANDKVPIIAMTANALKETKERCFEAGMTDFLTKPVTVDCLKERLEKYFQKLNKAS
jgi:two-component system, sensor histidine kinase and response regulator